MLVLWWIVIGSIIGFFINQLVPDRFSRIHVDIISGAVGGPLGYIISSPFTSPDDIQSKLYSFGFALMASIVCVFLARIAKL